MRNVQPSLRSFGYACMAVLLALAAAIPCVGFAQMPNITYVSVARDVNTLVNDSFTPSAPVTFDVQNSVPTAWEQSAPTAGKTSGPPSYPGSTTENADASQYSVLAANYISGYGVGTVYGGATTNYNGPATASGTGCLLYTSPSPRD